MKETLMSKKRRLTEKTRPAVASQPDDRPALTVKTTESVALARLIEEVRNEGAGPLGSSTAYNRTYHRHNR
jgi:hypothetical protein